MLVLQSVNVPARFLSTAGLPYMFQRSWAMEARLSVPPGLKLPSPSPFMIPSSETHFTGLAYQEPAGTSGNLVGNSSGSSSSSPNMEPKVTSSFTLASGMVKKRVAPEPESATLAPVERLVTLTLFTI